MKFSLAFSFAPILLAPVVVLAGCGGGLNPVPDSDDNRETTLSGRISRADFYDSRSRRNYDIFVCDALSTDKARVEMQSGDFDTQFYVYQKGEDGTYTEIDSNDDADPTTSDSDDRFSVTRGKTYRILATSARPEESGNYQIRFSRELSRPAQVTTDDGDFRIRSLPLIGKKK